MIINNVIMKCCEQGLRMAMRRDATVTVDMIHMGILVQFHQL